MLKKFFFFFKLHTELFASSKAIYFIKFFHRKASENIYRKNPFSEFDDVRRWKRSNLSKNYKLGAEA